MMKARLAAVAGVIAFTCVVPSRAAVVPVKPGPTVAAPAAPLVAASGTRAEAAAMQPSSFALLDGGWGETAPTRLAPPPVADISRAALDAAGATRAAAPASAPHGEPFYAHLLSAGLQVLDLAPAPEARKQQAAPTISAAPLPGALWLFGSALLAFLGISGRRKF